MTQGKRFPFLSGLLLITATFACSIYANLSFAVTNRADYRYFPPFKPNYDGNWNRALGGEYFNMARSLAAGEGFAHPFDQPTGPTAWQPPVLPIILAAVLWACDGSHDGVMAAVIFAQVFVLIGTGVLVLALVRQTSRIDPFLATAVFLAGMLCHFRFWFQYTHDSWIVLLELDLLLAGLCWWRPLERWQSAAGWGLFGGLCALTTPVVGFTWAILSFLAGLQQRSRLALALLVAGLTLTPWTVRNYRVFGRLIPVKANLAYELYQTQCLQEGGLLLAGTFRFHPYHKTSLERQEYSALGETAYLDRKREQFGQAVWADPLDFLGRVGVRCVGVTLWDVPLWTSKAEQPVVFRLHRVTHPLPFLAVLVLLAISWIKRLHPAQWAVIGAYIVYLLPYVATSYYERYAVPLLGVKVLLVLWAADRFFDGVIDWRVSWVLQHGRLVARSDGRDPSHPCEPARPPARPAR